MAFDSTTEDTFVTCEVSFGSQENISMGDSSSANNFINGLLTLDIFTEEGIGAGANFTIGKRLRDLYNRVTVSYVIFDSPIGPEILQSSPEVKFQTQLRITFETFEEF